MVQHKGTKSMETIRLLLRKFKETDAVDMFRNWAADPEVSKYLTWTPYQSLPEVQDKVKEWVADYFSDTYRWAIIYKLNSQVIGSISVVGYSNKNQTCEVGYCIGREYWGLGIATEALHAVMLYLFYETGFHRIQAFHDVLNQASGKVMQKAGMQFEGIMRHAKIRKDGSFCDLAVYSLLRNDLK